MKEEMKLVECCSASCGERRQHWCQPYKKRKHRTFEVPKDSKGPWYCSIECAAYAKGTDKI